MSFTRLLISVRNAQEAVVALENGADWIDIKEPSRGSLGMASTAAMQSVVAAVEGRVPVSAALGELIDAPTATPLPAGISHAKAGLHAAGLRPWRQRLADLFGRLPGVAPIAAAYVGPSPRHEPPTPTPQEVLDWAIRHRAAGVLLDTHEKSGGNLLDFCDAAWLRSFIDRARAGGLMVALAGSLRDEAFTKALTLEPDVIAVRGAACIGGQRLLAIDARRVRLLAEQVRRRRAAGGPPRHRRGPLPAMRDGG